jgi:hypothetical protein
MTATETVEHTVTAVTAVSFALTGYYNSVLVENLTATSGVLAWARADGTAAVAGADGCFPIEPGTSLVLDNGLPTWSQALSVIQSGSLTGGTPGTPALVQPFGSSLAGGTANPGCSVSVILDTTGSVSIAVSSVD